MSRSPYDALLSQMADIMDLLDSQTAFDNTEARKVYNECARRIHLATVPDPLHHPQTRPPAINEALNDAALTGDGFLHLTRAGDGRIVWTRRDPHDVVMRALPTQGE
jgi:hypothetical protein